MNSSGSDRVGPQDGGALILGAVETCLVQNTSALTDEVGRELLQLIPGRTVSRVDYPVKRAVSPDQLEGVDCRLRLNGKGGRARGIGTVAWHAVLSGGRVLQGSAYSRLVTATADYRRSWDHYLRQPGVIEVIGKHDPIALEDGYLKVTDAQSEAAEGLDLAAIGNKAVHAVHRSAGDKRLDYRTPLNTTPGQLRWAAILQQGGRQTVGIRKEAGKNSYSLRLTGSPDDLKTFVRFAEDLALHVWLLAVAASANEKATRGEAARVVPVFMDELYGLWLPARGRVLRRLWAGVLEVTGYQDRWEIEINRLTSKSPVKQEEAGYRRPPGRDRRS